MHLRFAIYFFCILQTLELFDIVCSQSYRIYIYMCWPSWMHRERASYVLLILVPLEYMRPLILMCAVCRLRIHSRVGSEPATRHEPSEHQRTWSMTPATSNERCVFITFLKTMRSNGSVGWFFSTRSKNMHNCFLARITRIKLETFEFNCRFIW